MLKRSSQVQAGVPRGAPEVGGRVPPSSRRPKDRESASAESGLTSPPPAARLVALHRPPSGGLAAIGGLPTGLPPHPILNGLGRGDQGLLLLSECPLCASEVRSRLLRCPITYQVRISRRPDPALIARVVRGVTDQGDFLAATRANLIPELTDDGWLVIEMAPSARGSVRRLLTAFSVVVAEVVRTAMGPIQLNGLPVGAWRELTRKESAAVLGQMAPGPTPGSVKG